HRGKAEVMLAFDTPVGSIAFGSAGSRLDGLLFVSNNAGAKPDQGGDLYLVDLASLNTLALAKGGSRGGTVRTTADRRVLIGEAHQVDVLNPISAPRVAATNPPRDALVGLPLGTIGVAFDHDMLVGDPSDPHSVLNPANYRLIGDASGPI